MRTFLVYLRLELKRALKNIPHFLAGAIVLTVLLGAIAFSAAKMLYQGTAVGQIEVGVVLPEDDQLAKKAISMISSLESVGSLCNFSYVNEETGKDLLRKGDLYALMQVPEGFIQGIIDGTNTPVTVILPANAGLEASVLKSLTDSGARTLGIAQAAIYASDEFCYLHGMADSIFQVENDLNALYMRYSLSRSGYFKERMVSAVGDIPVISYYGISAAMLFLLLSGIPSANLAKPPSKVFCQKLRLIGIGRVKLTLVKILSLTVSELLVSSIFVLPMMGKGLLQVNIMSFAAWFLVCVSVSAMILFFYHLAGNAMAGVMLLFLSAVIMVFLSGGFIPSVFLPGQLRELGNWMPTTVIMDAMKVMVAGGSFDAVRNLTLLAAGLFCLAAAVRRNYE